MDVDMAVHLHHCMECVNSWPTGVPLNNRLNIVHFHGSLLVAVSDTLARFLDLDSLSAWPYWRYLDAMGKYRNDCFVLTSLIDKVLSDPNGRRSSCVIRGTQFFTASSKTTFVGGKIKSVSTGLYV